MNSGLPSESSNRFGKRQFLSNHSSGPKCVLLILMSSLMCFSAQSDLTQFFKDNSLVGKWVQRQYEVDLEAPTIWVFSFYVDCDDGSFMQTQGTLDIENIALIQEGKLPSAQEELRSGFAYVDKEFLRYSPSKQVWIKDNRDASSEIKSICDSFGYFTTNSCTDWGYEVEKLENELQEERKSSSKDVTIDNRVVEIEKNLSRLTASNDMKVSFDRGKWKIDVTRGADGRIAEWAVSESGIIVRRIVNEAMPKQFKFPKAAEPENSMDVAKIETSPLRGKKGIGLFISVNDDGDIVVRSVAKDSPAFVAGFKKGDMIATINGVAVNGLQIADVSKMFLEADLFSIGLIRGNPGIKKSLSVEKRLME